MLKSMYLDKALDITSRKIAIANMVKKIKKNFDLNKIDAIACCGYSGLLIAPSVADILGKSLLIVRRQCTTTHSCYLVEGDIDSKTYIIIDDFINTGETINYIITTISRYHPPKCVGIVCYLKNYSSTTTQYLVEKKIIDETVKVV